MRIPNALFMLYRMSLWLGGSIFGLLFVFFFVMSLGRIDGFSMEPGLVDQELFVVNKFVYLFRQPQRQEIVQLVDLKNKHLVIKRVIGLPGEKLKHSGNCIYRWQQGSWVLIEESYLAPYSETVFDKWEIENEIINIPKNTYYLLGDNRLSSFDSRQRGFIKREDIVGKVIDLFN